MKKFSAPVKSICVCLLCLILFLPSGVYANSAPSYWIGTTAFGSVVTDKDCPLVVTKEILTFDLPTFPENYYFSSEEFDSYDAQVQASYTFYNPASYAVTATLLFPFGAIPDYIDKELFADPSLYEVTINGTVIEPKLRHSLILDEYDFDLERDLSLLEDDFVSDSFYSTDTPVTCYTYRPDGIDTEDFVEAAFVFDADPEKTKVILEDQSGLDLLDDGVRLSRRISDSEFHIYVIGEDFTQPPQWQLYEDATFEHTVSGSVLLTDTQVLSFEDYVFSEYHPESAINLYDWYNAAVACLNQNETSGVTDADTLSNLPYMLMRWYEYSISLDPGQTLTNTVYAPIYPSADGGYDPAIYSYTYLLSPAQEWASFGELEVHIHTPYYLIEDSFDQFRQTSTGYHAVFSTLPKGELTFCLSSEPQPENTGRSNLTSYLLMILAVIGLLLLGLILIIVLLVVLIRSLMHRRR